MIRYLIETVVYSIFRFPSAEKMSFYAVAKGRQVGIYPTWAQCEAQIKSFPGAKFKKFSTQDEAASFISGGSNNDSNIFPAKPKSNQLYSASYGNSSKVLSDNVPSQVTYSTSSQSSSSSHSFYAVAKGKNVGVYSTWTECKSQIEGVQYPKYKKFSTYREAEEFVNENSSTTGRKTSSQTTGKSLVKKTSVPTDDDISFRSLSSATFRNHNFQQDNDGFVHCYTDGSCEGNGQNGARAGVGVWFAADHPLNVSEPVVGPPTNNVAEIQAATKAIRVAQECGITKLQINTDSQFLIKCITQWMPNWKRNGWKLSTGGDVKNREQLEELHNAMKTTTNIKWNYVKAHKGIEGNEHADRLARAGAANFQQKSNSHPMRSSGNRYKPY